MSATYWALPFLGILIGVAASFTGLGGGFLMVPILLLMGFSAEKAVGTSFAGILVISIAALLAHNKLAGVDWKAGLLFGVGGFIGAQYGPRLLHMVDDTTFKRIFAGVLVALAAYLLFKK